MINFTYTDGKLTKVSTEYSQDAINRNDMLSIAHAEKIAADATSLTSKLHIGVNRGNSMWPRFDVIEAPRVGSEVSKAFNGDYYPAGTIVKVSKSLRLVTTSTGQKFYRRGQTGTWLAGGMWAMVPGTISERNPSF